ncbi:ankyrin repeat protein [Megavirus baoshan]|uniref:Ankyrin repeat protein n=1 Tax=Megavirus baoshan TaxID=2496520 RepID=A0A3Q8U933_9VIRU|nr:ankyrin repeat protein [Megavirus baoshan]AZL89895.1 ankyrin repeat protein [Megavirus baoshan]
MNLIHQNNLSQLQTILDNNDFDLFRLSLSEFIKTQFDCVDILYILIRRNKLIFINILYQECMQNNSANSDYVILSLARDNHYDILRYMIDLGADLHTKTNPGRALVEACVNGNTQIIELLLQYGVMVESNTSSIFCHAYGKNDIIVINLLLNYLDIEILKEEFYDACKYADIEIIKLFIDRGININCCPKKIFDHVIYNHNAKVFELLLDNGLELNYEDDYIISIIRYIIVDGRVSFINILINDGFDLSCLNKYAEKKIPRSFSRDEMTNILMNNGVDAVNILKLLN